MYKRVMSLIFCLCLLLCGCQLAQPNSQQENVPDALVGVFVTTEALAMPTDEALIQQLLGNNPVQAECPRYYATQTQDGFAFEGLTGMLLASDTVQPQDENSYTTTVADDGLLFVNTKLHHRDDGSDTTLEASILLPRGSGELFFHLNPVYQDAEGRLYTVPGDIGSFFGEFGSATTTISESFRRTENGTTCTETATISISLDSADVPKRIRILSMDGNNRILDTQDYPAGSLPEQYTPSAETAYILVEEYTDAGVARKLYQQDSDWIEIFQVMPNGICTMHSITLHWPE